MTTIQLTEMNKFVLTNYKNMKKIDEYLIFSNIYAATGIVLSVMSTVYVWIFARIKFLMSLLELNVQFQTVQYISFV